MKTKGEERRNWQGTEKENSEKKETGEGGRGYSERRGSFISTKAWRRGESGQGQTEEIHSRINTRGCDSSFLLLLFPL